MLPSRPEGYNFEKSRKRYSHRVRSSLYALEGQHTVRNKVLGISLIRGETYIFGHEKLTVVVDECDGESRRGGLGQ